MKEKDVKGAVKRFNKHKPKGMNKEYKYTFSVTNDIMKYLSEDKLDDLLRYTMNQAITVYNFYPHELVFHDFIKEAPEGGEFQFYFWCQR